MKRILLFIALTMLLVVPATAQNDQDCSAMPILMRLRHGTTLAVIPVHELAGFDSPVGGELAADALIQTLDAEPQCVDGVWWWQVTNGMDIWNGWMPEQVEGEYVVERYRFVPEAPVPFDVPMQQPVITDHDLPLPTVAPTSMPDALDVPFIEAWDWEAFTADYYLKAADPLALELPDQYMGDLPVPPVDLSNVYFVRDANLNTDQLALLAQNGFVVIPGTYDQFDAVYQYGWEHHNGRADFITTDTMLHSLYLAYQNALMFLEINTFYGQIADVLMAGYQNAEQQYIHEAQGTPLEAAARNAAIYYAVPLTLLAQGEDHFVEGYEQTPVYGEGSIKPSDVIAAADPAIIAEAQALVDAALAAEGRLSVPILEEYEEDFSQYQPRSYYAGNPLLESYFRAMMWLGRITFTAESQADTLTGLLVLRAMVSHEDAYAKWSNVAETLDFLVGPTDDYSPRDYAPIAGDVFGQETVGSLLSSLAPLQDAELMAAFKAQVEQLPPPRINSIPIAVGETTPEEVAENTRGFRLFGQRFTFDGYVMQQLIYPEVGTADMSRTLPLGLDVPAALGSNEAFALADEFGATNYANYTENVAALREEVNGIGANDWLQNLYGGWLWALQGMVVRDPALVPPLMQTDAWQRKDLASMLGSYTELKHATLLYAEQPMGGLGGGGMEPPVISYSYVEPNPKVFARIAVVAMLLDQGMTERGLFDQTQYNGLTAVHNALASISALSAKLAEYAAKEIAGEALSYEEYYYLQESFDDALWYIRYGIEEWITDPPENTALIADIASNAASGEALEIAIANPDTIYVITNSPYGLQLTRGAVYSYYEFTVGIDERMTDDEWRTLVDSGETPARPDWISLYFSE